MNETLKRLGIEAENPGLFTDSWSAGRGEVLESRSPIDGALLARVSCASPEQVARAVAVASERFDAWRTTPAPLRGDIVRQMGDQLRKHKEDLAMLVTLEMGKSLTEGRGEVQEMIDMADFCVGLSRQLYGLSMHSERPGHRMYEQWHPLGPVGVITAFNFPVAVWAWNAFVALVSGDPVIWKPSEETPLTAIAVQRMAEAVLEPAGLSGLCSLVVGDRSVGDALVHDKRVPLISATGSCRMGREVAPVVAARFGRCLLELGGNNALVVMEDADLDLAVRGIVFGAVGTAGQRCTSTRRVLVERGVAAELEERLLKAYASLKIGDPRDPANHLGPLSSPDAARRMQVALHQIRAEGGEILTGGELIEGSYVKPCLVRAPADLPIMREETFAPILYLVPVDDVDDAIQQNNAVDQGLSSAIFTTDLRTSERFLSAAGSDCGIANVNIGTSGAEIGGAFGGEKHTGGGREAGSDAWKAYMRRQTCTLNYTSELPLAQGVEF